MRVIVIGHQRTGEAYAKALADYGHHHVPVRGEVDARTVDALLVDTPACWGEGSLKWELARAVHRCGGVVMEIPHGGPPIHVYDGKLTVPSFVDVLAVPAAGHRWLYGQYGVAQPAVVFGWHLGELASFRPCLEPRRVVFAPAHPNSAGGGTIGDPQLQALNAFCYRQFLELDVEEKRLFMYGTWEGNGLWPDGRCERVESRLDPAAAVAEIDAADAVISYGTFAWLAVVRGTPTVTFGNDRPPIDDDGSRIVRSWHTVSAAVRYPYDLLDSPLRATLAVACRAEATEWRERWIGGPFQPRLLVETVERLVRERRPAPVGAPSQRKQSRAKRRRKARL